MYETLPVDEPVQEQDSRLLLIEDDDGDALLVQELLDGGDLELVRVRTLAEARPHLAGQSFGCVLLDLGLPDAQGLEAVHEVLAAGGRAVVCLTGLDDAQRGIAAVAAGAQDYLIKGTVDGQLLRRSVRYAIERRRADGAARQLFATRLRAEENARLERGLLPVPQIFDPSLGVTARYRPTGGGALGGDFYDVVETPDGRVFVLLGDVAGHGPDEAALGVSLRIAWRALVLAGVGPERVFPVLEQVLVRERRSEDIFALASMLVIAADRRSATLWLAAHLPPMALDPAPSQVSGELTGPALGLLQDATWRGLPVPLPEEWRIMLYTDGLVEGRRGRGSEILGVPGLIELAAQSRLLPGTPVLVDDLLDRVEQAYGGTMPDDVAVVVLQWPLGGAPW